MKTYPIKRTYTATLDGVTAGASQTRELKMITEGRIVGMRVAPLLAAAPYTYVGEYIQLEATRAQTSQAFIGAKSQQAKTIEVESFRSSFFACALDMQFYYGKNDTIEITALGKAGLAAATNVNVVFTCEEVERGGDATPDAV